MDQNKIQQMQFLEQNLQNILMQKQAFSMEFSENEHAIKAVSDSNDKIYKVIGQLMIAQDKKDTIEELEQKKKLIESRIDALSKQEVLVSKELNRIKDEITSNKANDAN